MFLNNISPQPQDLGMITYSAFPFKVPIPVLKLCNFLEGGKQNSSTWFKYFSDGEGRLGEIVSEGTVDGC